MARRSKKAGDIVDGFTTMQAAQRAMAGSGDKPRPKPSNDSSLEQKKPAAGAADGLKRVRIGHTTQPTRHDIVCYECRYGFVLTGKLEKTYCPKCRCALEADEYTIDRDWNSSARTIGTVRVLPGGIVTGGKITANVVALEGSIAGGKVEAFGRLELHPGGQFDPAAVDARDLVVAPDAEPVFYEELTFRNIEIGGRLTGAICATGVVRVRSGGMFCGSLRSHCLTVDDGGALKADLNITPQSKKSRARKTKAKEPVARRRTA